MLSQKLFPLLIKLFFISVRGHLFFSLFGPSSVVFIPMKPLRIPLKRLEDVADILLCPIALVGPYVHMPCGTMHDIQAVKPRLLGLGVAKARCASPTGLLLPAPGILLGLALHSHLLSVSELMNEGIN